MEHILGVIIGVGLSASCGFRVFVPMLVMSIASYAGMFQLSEGFAWIGSPFAIVAFVVATGFEVCGYYIPWLDNLLDTMATPAAVVAGVILTAACVTDMHPALKWSIAAIAGGGAAAVIQSGTALIRGASTAATGGIANPIIATLELFVSFVMSVAAIVVPVLTLIAFFGIVVYAIRLYLRRRARMKAADATLPPCQASPL